MTIGFVMEFYEVTEGQQSDVEICTLLSSGQLEREAVVRLATLDVSARGLLNIRYLRLLYVTGGMTL